MKDAHSVPAQGPFTTPESHRRRSTRIVLLLASGLLAAATVHGGPRLPAFERAAQQQQQQRDVAPAPVDPARTPDVIYVPTPQLVVDRMLQLARPKKGEVVYDLGCGDGRIVITAAKRFGNKAVGFDIDPERVAEARANVKKNNVEHLVTIEQRDIFKVDLSPASVVTLYLLPELNVRLIPQLQQLKPGSRIVSHDFDMRGVKPEKTLSLRVKDRSHLVYLWRSPLVRESITEESSETRRN